LFSGHGSSGGSSHGSLFKGHGSSGGSSHGSLFSGHGSSGGSSHGSLFSGHGSSGGSSHGSLFSGHGSSGGSSHGSLFKGHGSSGGSSHGSLFSGHGSSGGSSHGSLFSGHGSNGGSSHGSLFSGHGSNGGASYGSGGGYYMGSNVAAPSPISNVLPTSYVAAPVVQPSAGVAYLNVNVPADAKVYLQDQLMTIGGTARRFVTPEMRAGVQHLYTVKVEVVRNGQTVSKTAQATVVAGQEVAVEVAFDAQNQKELVASAALVAAR
jgi:uncharacterized protein (TIGR03000 family)